MNRDKALYRELRVLPWSEIWSREVPRFNSAPPKQRIERVAVIRAAAVVFAESGPDEQSAEVKSWLRSLLKDPAEKVRRYAITALPKLCRDSSDEKELLAMARAAVSDREKQHVAAALGKIGSVETLRHADALPEQTVQRIKASVTRFEQPSRINLDRPLSNFQGVEIHLRTRLGLEQFVAAEARELIEREELFRLGKVATSSVTLIPAAPFKLADLYKLRCFWSVGFAVTATGKAKLQLAASTAHFARDLDAFADLITAEPSLSVLRAFTEGPTRYRLEFAKQGHRRAAVRDLAQRVFAKCPHLLNGGGDTPWTIEIHSDNRGEHIELVPKILPDPRFSYRRADVPAASHPPLAAALARLSTGPHGGPRQGAEVVWDPFCGSGLELIERGLLGGVAKVIGSDLSAEAVEITRTNFAASNIAGVECEFIKTDFRKFDPGRVTLIITNPPLGRRVPVPNLRRLMEQLFESAARALEPGGCLVFVNPVKESFTTYPLRRVFSQPVDLGGFLCRLEKYVK